jgi:hypothetical protein
MLHASLKNLHHLDGRNQKFFDTVESRGRMTTMSIAKKKKKRQRAIDRSQDGLYSQLAKLGQMMMIT